MAKTKTQKAVETAAVENEVTEVSTTETKATTNGPSYEELMAVVQQLTREVAALKSNASSNSNVSTSDDAVEILSKLANRKSDREVSIVHNCELNGGLTTHIALTNLGIDFQHVGETRLLSWQQFEECASKYRSFFDRKIIMLGEEYAELAERYNLPCMASTGHGLTSADISKLSKLSVRELEEFISSLSPEEQDTIFSYWMGKAYERVPEFYDRYKIETLNRLSNGGFANLLLIMNGDAVEGK